MRILSIKAIKGPNVWAYRPVMVMKLDLEDLADRASNEVPGFIERLLALVPGVAEHGCDTGEPGRFGQRLHRGTYFAHITEHVTIELLNLAGIVVSFGKARYAGSPGVYNVVVRCKAEEATRYLLRTAVELIDAIVAGREFDLAPHLAEAQRIVGETELGPSTRAIVEAAERRGIPWRRLNGDSLVQFGYGIYRKHLQAAMSSHSSAIAVEVVGDKELTKKVLQDALIPLPQSHRVTSADEAVEAWRDLGVPVVTKPVDGNQGRGVSLNLHTEEQVRAGYEVASGETQEGVLVEEYLHGKDYRILVVDGRLVAASEREPAQVCGDGQHCVHELVELTNRDPRRGDGHEKELSKLRLDPIALATLAKQDCTPDTILPAGQAVRLRDNANLSTGGTARDVTDLVHPSTAALCERAARIVGLDICGIDLVAPDIRQPLARGVGGIVELNAAPGLRMHLHPSEGNRREVGDAIINMLYPPGMPFRVPIFAITGSNGKTTVTRMIGHILSAGGYTVGMTTTDAVYIGGKQVVTGDMTGPVSARAVLADPAVEIAVLETARGGIVRSGLGWDWADVGIITNIQADHIGQDGIEDIDDLIWIKSLVAERVREGGTIILNAEDPHVARLAESERIQRIPRRIVYFALKGDNRLIQQQKAAGETAYYVRDGWIVEATGRTERRIIQPANIPATLGGIAEFNIANALAAIAAVRSHGIPPAMIFMALSRFNPNENNPGRVNMYRVKQGYVILDYGHNPHAYENMVRLVGPWKQEGRRITAIIGLPGDRADWVTQEAARVAARGFDRLILREDHDRRGRASGELITLIRTAVQEVNREIECLDIPDEAEALETAITTMSDGEVIVLFYDEIEPIRAVLARHGAADAAVVGETVNVLNLDLAEQRAAYLDGDR